MGTSNYSDEFKRDAVPGATSAVQKAHRQYHSEVRAALKELGIL